MPDNKEEGSEAVQRFTTQTSKMRDWAAGLRRLSGHTRSAVHGSSSVVSVSTRKDRQRLDKGEAAGLLPYRMLQVSNATSPRAQVGDQSALSHNG